MSKSPEDRIEEKLRQLEVSMREETNSNVPAAIEKSTGLAGSSGKTKSGKIKLSKELEAEAAKADLTLLGGFGALLAGVLLLLSNMRVSTGWPFGGFGGMFGVGNGQGLLILLLLIGLGFFFYDYKNKIGWALIVISLAAIIFSIFLTMHVYIPNMSLFGFLFMMIPIVLGGGLIAKALKRHREIEEKASE